MNDAKKETAFYEKLEDNYVRCNICPRRCEIKEGGRGFCKVRENVGGTLFSLVYGRSVSTSVDSIEKKPLFHFAPGSRAYSICTVGCNLKCDFCQNYRISRGWKEIKGKKESPSEVIENAMSNKSDGIAYTYTEPTVFYEYARDIMLESKDLYNVFVSNGYMSDKVINELSKNLDAINIDIKGNEKFYSEHCGINDIEPIFNSAKRFKENGVWVEITNLIIPGENDTPEDFKRISRWIRDNLGQETPLHFSRFSPYLELREKPPTDISTLEKAMEISNKVGMDYVYCGNVPGHQSESTYCPNCDKELITRRGFSITNLDLNRDMSCPQCGKKISIAGEKWIPDRFF
ncbi:MAG: Pyruvate-formate lyase-activating enzyme [Candidatus Methanohalarchaeum thermophilum]|uniref:Pyruvate-formate lyase-activating enzyme n=1 Tax=Methanohalarchaeum thermophilum TaxID=1903181 RepID=A0A1Q6DUZ2_METT1|nr:MAG: Pyruvate-formate lyase-activating enzyme [Candidatus Methanohalarchaeum thermophilum]